MCILFANIIILSMQKLKILYCMSELCWQVFSAVPTWSKILLFQVLYQAKVISQHGGQKPNFFPASLLLSWERGVAWRHSPILSSHKQYMWALYIVYIYSSDMTNRSAVKLYLPLGFHIGSILNTHEGQETIQELSAWKDVTRVHLTFSFASPSRGWPKHQSLNMLLREFLLL